MRELGYLISAVIELCEYSKGMDACFETKSQIKNLEIGSLEFSK